MSLKVENLSLSRGEIRIFEEITFQCDPGQAIILRGPNGVGKTSLLRTLAGFLKPHSGDVTLNGTNLANRDDVQGDLIYAGHADAIKAQLTVAENIGFWAELYGSDKRDAALAAFDLKALGYRLAGTCSAGQKRRLGLARLLVSGRALWLLDEPTVALDKASRDALAQVLRDHLSGGGMAVMATHDADLLSASTVEMTPPSQIFTPDPYWGAEAQP